MTKEELYKELEFVRAQVKVFKERANCLEKEDWINNVNNDSDKRELWSRYTRIVSELGYLLKYDFDAE